MPALAIDVEALAAASASTSLRPAADSRHSPPLHAHDFTSLEGLCRPLLFEDASLQVNRGDRVGLVGPNGAGKSTLFSLILGEASPDEGRVSLEKSATIGFLPQEHAPAGEETVLELACAVSPEVAKAQRIMKTTPEDSAEHHEALHSFDEHGGWQLEPKQSAFWLVSLFANRISIGRRKL